MENEHEFQIGKYQCTQTIFYETQHESYNSYINHCIEDNSLNPVFKLDFCESIKYDNNKGLKYQEESNYHGLIVKTCISSHLTAMCTQSTITPNDLSPDFFSVCEELIIKHCKLYLYRHGNKTSKNDSELIDDVIHEFRKQINHD